MNKLLTKSTLLSIFIVSLILLINCSGKTDTGKSFHMLIEEVAAGPGYSCALFENGKVKCWGINGDGRLGQGDTNPRGASANEMGNNLQFIDLGSSTVKAISVGGIVCVLLELGEIKCWGDNTYGQLGLGDMSSRGDEANEMGSNLPSVDLGTEDGTETGLPFIPKAVSVGGSHVCALSENGRVKCWGYNRFGQLGLGDLDPRGDGDNEMGNNLPSVDLGMENEQPLIATAISAGSYHTCALFENGKAKCWGSNNYGQLGQGDTDSRGDGSNEMGDNLDFISLGTNASGTKFKVAGIFSGSSFTCALIEVGGVKCWGINYYGQLGQGDVDSRGDGVNEMGNYLRFVHLGLEGSSGLLLTKELSLGFRHVCAVSYSDLVKCWGDNGNGELGLGDTNSRGDDANEMADNLPYARLLGSGGVLYAIRSISSGGNNGSGHTCASFSNRRVKCWGNNSSGQLGLGNTINYGDEEGKIGNAIPFVSL